MALFASDLLVQAGMGLVKRWDMGRTLIGNGMDTGGHEVGTNRHRWTWCGHKAGMVSTGHA